MKAHIGVDADSGLVHSVVGTSANVSDVSQAHALLHGHEEEAFGDAGYIGVDKRDEMKDKSVKWQVAAKRGKIKAMRRRARETVSTTIRFAPRTPLFYCRVNREPFVAAQPATTPAPCITAPSAV